MDHVTGVRWSMLLGYHGSSDPGNMVQGDCRMQRSGVRPPPTETHPHSSPQLQSHLNHAILTVTEVSNECDAGKRWQPAQGVNGAGRSCRMVA